MKFEIRSRWDNSVIFTAEIEARFETESHAIQLGAAVKVALKSRADLRGADLADADLAGADLAGADLARAYLAGADLAGADLAGANLAGAYLADANLARAYLAGADLAGADLAGAKNVGDFTMPDGLKFSEYLRDVVPALLTAGGKTVKEIVDAGAWDCHSWDNCPMHAAFGISRSEDGPPLLRARIKEFVQLFDGGLIPKPVIEEAA